MNSEQVEAKAAPAQQWFSGRPISMQCLLPVFCRFLPANTPLQSMRLGLCWPQTTIRFCDNASTSKALRRQGQWIKSSGAYIYRFSGNWGPYINSFVSSSHFLNSEIHDDVIKWKHFPCYWPFMWGIHQSALNSTHKGQWHWALMYSLICAWINAWVNNLGAGDLRCYHTN